jgi:hypothetical protein
MTTIASYRKAKISFHLTFAALMLAFVPYITFWSYGGRAISRAIHSPGAVWMIPFLLYAWFYEFVVAGTIIIKFNRLIFHNGAAVWIDQKKLMFMRSWYVSVPCDEIAEVALGFVQISRFLKDEAVVVRLKDGRETMFPTSSLSESRDVIIARIKAALDGAARESPQTT